MKISIFAVGIFTLALSACSGGEEAPEADAVTETRMDEVDVIDGTISDDMVDLDTQRDSDSVEGEDSAETGSDADVNTSDESETAEDLEE